MKNIYLIVIGALVLVTGCIQEDANVIDQGSEPSPDFNVDLSINGDLVLDNEVEITLTVTSNLNYPISEINNRDLLRLDLILPDEIEFIEGDLEWEGDLPSYGTHTITAKIKSTEIGYFEIKGIATFGDIEKVEQILYIKTDVDSAIVSERPLTDESPDDPDVRRGYPVSGENNAPDSNYEDDEAPSPDNS